MDEEYGQYSIKELLGQGGVGRVFLAFDRDIRRQVALKEPRTDRDGVNKEKVVARFIREARITGQLEHPNIVPVYELNKREDGSSYYVMRYVSGRTLYQAIKDCETEDPDRSFALRMGLLNNFIDVCDAMGYAHSKGVIHRDLKPGNIILGDYGETVIIDWGIAKLYRAPEADSAEGGTEFTTLGGDIHDAETRQDTVLGTPSYMAPEQLDSRFGDVDPRSDVYSLGVMLFMLLTGEKPYPGRGRDVIDLVVNSGPLPSPEERYPRIPPELVAICRKALSKERKARFANASEMAKELKAYRDGRLVSIYNYSRMELFRRFVARNRLAISFTAALILSIIIGAGLSLDFARKAHKAMVAAERALVDVADLSERTMSLAHDTAVKLQSRIDTIREDMRTARSGRDLVRMHPDVEEFFAVGHLSRDIEPDRIFRTEDGRFAFYIVSGRFVAMLGIDRLTLSVLPFDPVRDPYQIWCVRNDGEILYDEDPAQIGKHLFTDAMYSNFPELLVFGDRMKNRPLGIGYYRFHQKNLYGPEVHKIAAWDTVNAGAGVSWKIVATYPYIAY